MQLCEYNTNNHTLEWAKKDAGFRALDDILSSEQKTLFVALVRQLRLLPCFQKQAAVPEVENV